jgi:hypothetical protein
VGTSPAKARRNIEMLLAFDLEGVARADHSQRHDLAGGVCQADGCHVREDFEGIEAFWLLAIAENGGLKALDDLARRQHAKHVVWRRFGAKYVGHVFNQVRSILKSEADGRLIDR